MRFVRILAAVCLAGALFAAVPAHANCGAEGCPLVRDGLGSVPTRFAFDLRYQDVTQDKLWNGTRKAGLAEVVFEAGAPGEHGEVELFTRTRSWVAEGRARVNDRLLVTVTLPYVQREHRHLIAHTRSFNPAFIEAWRYDGLGDGTVIGQFRALRTTRGPSMTLQGGVKLPTGRRHLPDEARVNNRVESTLEPSARPGSGSTDWIAGALLSQALPWKRSLPLTGSVLARFNARGTDEFAAGDEVQAGLSSGYAPLAWLTLLGQVNYSGHGSDESADASEVAHTGMRTLYLTPGATARLSPLLSMYALFQTRIWGKSDEATVVAQNHFVFGTTYAIGH